MAVRKSDSRKLAGFAALGLLLAASGCQSGDGASNVLNLGGGQTRESTEDERVTVQELTAFCPAITVPESLAVHSSYQRNAQDDPSRLIYRAAITDATRSCTYRDGIMGMTIALAGRIIPGPAGTTGSVRVPIRITIYRDAETLHSQTVNHEVAVADTAGATQFVFTDSSFSMPNPTSRNVRIVAGMDTQAATR